METMEVFHVDIINDILLRLPAKSLLRFKSVCKSWYDLISSPDFANRHLQRSLITQSNLHFVFRKPGLHMGDFDSFENAIELNYPYKNLDGGGASIIGSCNGLLCLWNYDNDNFSVFLFNPTTQTHKMIPILPRPFHTLHLPHTFIHGFGYDSVMDDYKFVRIFQCTCQKTGLSYSELMVYSLKSNSWTQVIVDVPIRFDCKRADGVLVNENLHWVKQSELHEPPLPIVSFNLSTNSFGEVPLPKVDIHSHGFIHVGVLDGCLCILINDFAEFEILVMKEYGVVESWAKLIRFAKVKISHTIERTIAFTRDRKRLLVALSFFRVASIDLENMIMEEIDSSVNPLTRRCDATVCVENLLMLDDFSDLENEQQGGGNSKRRKRRTVGEDVRDTTETDERLLEWFKLQNGQCKDGIGMEWWRL